MKISRNGLVTVFYLNPKTVQYKFSEEPFIISPSDALNITCILKIIRDLSDFTK